jgi:hypothetical protein
MMVGGQRRDVEHALVTVAGVLHEAGALRRRVARPEQSAALEELLVARVAEHVANEGGPVLATGLFALLYCVKVAAVIWPVALFVAAALVRLWDGLVDRALEPPAVPVAVVARVAEGHTHERGPIPTPCLCAFRHMVEMAALEPPVAAREAAGHSTLLHGSSRRRPRSKHDYRGGYSCCKLRAMPSPRGRRFAKMVPQQG